MAPSPRARSGPRSVAALLPCSWGAMPAGRLIRGIRICPIRYRHAAGGVALVADAAEHRAVWWHGDSKHQVGNGANGNYTLNYRDDVTSNTLQVVLAIEMGVFMVIYLLTRWTDFRASKSRLSHILG